MKLSAVLSFVLSELAVDAILSTIPRLEQDAPAYNAGFEAAMKTPGMAIIGWVTGGVIPNAENQELALENRVILCVVENRAKNITGAAALEWVERIMERLHHAGLPVRRGPAEVTLDPEQPYELGPLGQGLIIYFVNLRVNSSQNLQSAGA